MKYLGEFFIDDVLPLSSVVHHPADGYATVVDATLAYRVYLLGNETPKTTGTLARFDTGNTTSLYTGSVTLSTAGGYAVGAYIVFYKAVVDSIAVEDSATFIIRAPKVTVADILAGVVESSGGSVTLAQACRLILAATAGATANQSTKFFAPDGTTARITGTVNETDRLSVTLTP